MRVEDEATHKRYGKCKILEIREIGITIQIVNEKGKIQLAADSGTTIDRFLEDDLKQFKECK